MKILKHIKRFYESNEYITSDDIHLNNDDQLFNDIRDIISNEIYLRDVPYGDGDQEKDPDSVDEATIEIIKMLKRKKVIN